MIWVIIFAASAAGVICILAYAFCATAGRADRMAEAQAAREARQDSGDEGGGAA